MSIIYDALHKAQKNLDGTGKESGPEKKGEKKGPKFELYALYALVICVGLVIGNYLFKSFPNSFKTIVKSTHANKTTIVAQKTSSQTITPPQVTQVPLLSTPQQTQTAAKKKMSPDSLVLNGIFFSEENGFALINNQITKVGDSVAGATVRKITEDQVELETKAGNKITLSTRTR